MPSCVFDTSGVPAGPTDTLVQRDVGPVLADGRADGGAAVDDIARDVATRDASDLGMQDAASPDAASPDSATPDSATPDSATPDSATPDSATPDLPQKPTIPIYTDILASDWSNWSWGAQLDLAATSPVKVGSQAVRVTFQGWGGFSLRKGASLSTAGYAALAFWVHGGSGSDKPLRVYTQTGDDSGNSTEVFVSAVANTWTPITVSLSSLGSPSTIKRLNITNFSGGGLPAVTFDELRLVP